MFELTCVLTFALISDIAGLQNGGGGSSQKAEGVDVRPPNTCNKNNGLDCGVALTSKHKYCVVGAGPAGVQMGHFLNKAGMDYAVFERGYRAGTFFNKFPVHRKLNSFNRRHARSAHPEFRMRHDGHTLLEHDEVPRFPNWTKEFWPMADTYVDYLEAFQKEQERAGKIHYCHTVVAINDIAATSTGNTRFELEIRSVQPCKKSTGWDGMKQQNVGSIRSLHHCEVLVMADGMWKPTDVALDPQPWITGDDLAIRYDQLWAVKTDEFDGKRVVSLVKSSFKALYLIHVHT